MATWRFGLHRMQVRCKWCLIYKTSSYLCEIRWIILNLELLFLCRLFKLLSFFSLGQCPFQFIWFWQQGPYFVQRKILSGYCVTFPSRRISVGIRDPIIWLSMLLASLVFIVIRPVWETISHGRGPMLPNEESTIKEN